MKSILLIGQSNMAGRGLLKETEPILSEQIHMLRNGRFQMMAEPIHNDRPNAGIGPAASFALSWANDHPAESIGLIPCAEGGSSIDEWQPGMPLFDHAISEACFAQREGEIVAILWHQGENDSANDLYQSYEEKLDTVFQTLRKELDLPDVPILIGGLPDFLNQFGYGLYSPQYEKINEILENYAQTHDHCIFVPAKGLTSNADGIHIDAKSQRTFGLRYSGALSGRYDPELSKEEAEQIMASLQSRPLTLKEQYMADELEYIHNKISFEELQERHHKLMSS